MTDTQVSSEQSQPLFLRVNNRNAASRALNAIRAENYAERTQQVQMQPHTKSAAQTSSNPSTPEADDFGFEDLLDMINPLQHIPVVSTLYQDITGDTISAPAKIVGGGIFGGITGLAGSVVDSIIEEVSGLDVGHHVLALFSGDDDSDEDQVLREVASSIAPENTSTYSPQTDAGKQLRTPENFNGIQLASHPTPKGTLPTTNQSAEAQPELPEIQQRIKDPKAAWSNRPNLSPTAFNALLSSFEDATKSTQAVAQQIASKDAADPTGSRTRGAAEIIQTSTLSQSKYTNAQASTPINDLLSKMQTGLDKYDRAKQQALQ